MNRKICFVSLGSYPLFSSNDKLKYAGAGGAEVKQLLIGNELASKGYNIVFITYDEEGEKKKKFDKITIIKTFKPFNNINFLKKVRWVWNSYKEANSEIYIQSGGAPGLIAFYCFVHKKKYIKWLSHDYNVALEGIEKKTSLYLKILFFIDIKLASLIIAQNEFQKNLIEKKFKKNCILIKNPINIPKKVNDFKIIRDKNVILWVATIRTFKQPELFLKIAQIFPNYRFRMIGGKSSSEPELYDHIQTMVKKIPNLEFLGFIAHDKMQEYYEEASILINTSKAEGFPNTFLEAWINCTPIISLNVDPDEVICNKKLGFHSKTFEQTILDVKTLLYNDKLRYELGINARKYTEEYHDLKKIISQFEKLISSFET
jgi:glycosyltransferase involved in cell wall biosynthesis